MSKMFTAITFFSVLTAASHLWSQQPSQDDRSSRPNAEAVNSQTQEEIRSEQWREDEANRVRAQNADSSHARQDRDGTSGRNPANATRAELLDGTTTQSKDRSGQDSRRANRWRYKRHNGEWWYWHPNEYWLIRRDGRWMRYSPETYRRPRGTYLNESEAVNGSADWDQPAGSNRRFTTDRYRNEPTRRHYSAYRGPMVERYDRYGRRYLVPDSRYYDGRYDDGRYYDDRFDGGRFNNGRFNRPYYYDTPGGRVGAGIGGAIGEAIGGPQGGRIGERVGGAIGSDR